MKSSGDCKLIPVLRRARRDWEIPSIDAGARLEEQQREARARAFVEGTTAYGREIFRRILDLASRRLQQSQNSLEAIKEVEEEIGVFPELHSEFVLLLGRTMGVEPAGLRQCSPRGWATQIVLRARQVQLQDTPAEK